jgi:anaerobic magnesium-protoporphyrin IX monomethyl ester cyclase
MNNIFAKIAKITIRVRSGSMSKRLLLITPPYHAGVVEAAGSWPNLGFIYLAGHARELGFEVQIYDAMTKNHTLDDIKARIKEFAPDFVGSTGYTASAPAGIEVLRVAKEVSPAIITIMGGIHANFMYEEILEQHSCYVDFVIRGEGEETLPQLLTAIEQELPLASVAGIAFKQEDKVVINPERPFIKDLDSLIPAWDLVDWEDYTFYVMPGSRLGLVNSSRGCSNNCSFCSQQKFWYRSYRARTPESFVGELEQLKQVYGVDVVMLSDEYPTKDRERWEQILDLLIERQVGTYLLLETCVEDVLRDRDIMDKYRKAGIIHIYVGVESTDPERLLSFQKNIKVEQSKEALMLLDGAGIVSECSFVLGMPDETKESIAKTLELAQMYGPDMAHFLHIAPWPYADIYEELKDRVKVTDYSKYNFTHPIVQPDNMTMQEMSDSLLDCYKTYYMKKMKSYLSISDQFKRDYMLRSVEVMANNSFLKEQMGGLGPIPKEVEELLGKLTAR